MILDGKNWEKIEIKGDVKPPPNEMHACFIYYGEIKGLITTNKNNIKPKKIQNSEGKIIDLNIATSNILTEFEGQEEETKQVNEASSPEVKNGKKAAENNGSYLLLFGGRNKEEFSEEIYVLNLQTYQWAKISSMPGKMCGFGSSIYEDKIFIFGGTDGQMFLNSLFYYDISKDKWFIFSGEKNLQLMPKLVPSMAINNEEKILLIFGGCSYENETNDIIILQIDENNLKKYFKSIKL